LASQVVLSATRTIGWLSPAAIACSSATVSIVSAGECSPSTTRKSKPAQASASAAAGEASESQQPNNGSPPARRCFSVLFICAATRR
jgi:hypothetical protein